MKRSLCVLAVGMFLGSAVTLGLVFWVQGRLRNAMAQRDPPGTTISGDVNGDGKLSVDHDVAVDVDELQVRWIPGVPVAAGKLGRPSKEEETQRGDGVGDVGGPARCVDRGEARQGARVKNCGTDAAILPASPQWNLDSGRATRHV